MMLRNHAGSTAGRKALPGSVQATLPCSRRPVAACMTALQRAYRPATRLAPSAASNSSDQSSSTQAVAAEDSSPRYTVQLMKPLGIVLEENATTKVITVSEVKPESAAAKQNVRVGDILLATSGIVYNRIEDYAGVDVKAGQEVVRMAVKGETLKTVGAAIRSHPGHMAVTLEFQRG